MFVYKCAEKIKCYEQWNEIAGFGGLDFFS
jgi:hypothetical protein